jgi:hypothetical protein
MRLFPHHSAIILAKYPGHHADQSCWQVELIRAVAEGKSRLECSVHMGLDRGLSLGRREAVQSQTANAYAREDPATVSGFKSIGRGSGARDENEGKGTAQANPRQDFFA